MEHDDVDDSLVEGFLSALWLKIWLGLAVLVFFSTLQAGTALALTMLLVFGYRVWETTIAKIHNGQMRSVKISLRNLAAQEFLRTGEEETLDAALLKADNLTHSPTLLRPLQAASAATARKLVETVTGCAVELAWIAVCAFLGLRFRSTVEAYIDQALRLVA